MYKFFVNSEQIKQDEVSIVGEDVNHIKNVLRLEINDRIEVTEITTSCSYECELKEVNKEGIKAKIIKKIEVSNEPKTYLHIFQGLPKADKLEWIIQKAVEVGVSEITPVMMERTIVKLEDKTKMKKTERWRKIAEVAAKQSKRDKIVNINLPINIQSIYEKTKNYDIVLIAYENESQKDIKTLLRQVQGKENLKIAVIIGPEGGLEEKEVEYLISQGAETITLGKRILRTETAPIVLASVIMYEFDEMK